MARVSPVLAALNLPSAVTLCGVLGGGGALYAGVSGRPLLCCLGVSLALLTDLLDGLLARRLNQTSDFGAQLDSLSDALAFVVTPALVLARLRPGAASLLCAAAYLLAGVGRLAAFHKSGTHVAFGRVCFYGVPTPAAGAAALLLYALCQRAPACAAAAPALLGALALLMISALPYPKRGAHDAFCAAAALLSLWLLRGAW